MTFLFKFLAVTGSAMFAGVMLAIGVILGGYWKSLPPADFLTWFAQHGELVKGAIPLVVLPTLAGLAGMLWAGWNGPSRALWLAASACIVAVLAMTILWFVPNNAAFAARAIPVDQVSARLDTWLMIHNLRIALAVAASALGLWAASR